MSSRRSRRFPTHAVATAANIRSSASSLQPPRHRAARGHAPPTLRTRLRADRTFEKDTFSGIAMHNLLFCPPLRAALAGAGSKPVRHDVLMLPEMCIAHIFCPPMNARERHWGVRDVTYNEDRLHGRMIGHGVSSIRNGAITLLRYLDYRRLPDAVPSRCTTGDCRAASTGLRSIRCKR